MARSKDSGSDRQAVVQLADETERADGHHPLAVGLALGAVVVVAAVLLIVQNAGSTRLEWLVFDFDAPLWLLFTAAFAAGMVSLLCLQWALKATRDQRLERRTLVRRARKSDAASRRFA